MLIAGGPEIDPDRDEAVRTWDGVKMCLNHTWKYVDAKWDYCAVIHSHEADPVDVLTGIGDEVAVAGLDTGSVNKRVDMIFDLPSGGSVALFAIFVALELGYTQIRTAGVYLDGPQHEIFTPAWAEHLPYLKGKVRAIGSRGFVAKELGYE